MQQSLFEPGAPSSDDPAVRAMELAEARWRTTAVVALAVAATALLVAVGALAAVLAR